MSINDKIEKDEKTLNESKRKIKKIIINLIVLFFSLLVFLIIAELVSKFIYNSPSSIVILKEDTYPTGANYVLSKNKELIYGSNYFNNKYLNPINYDRLLQKENDTFRILILGDSVAASFINNSNQYFSDKLEEELNKISGNVKIQVINTAVAGYNTLQEVEYFTTYGIKLNPDLVIVLFTTNDYDTLNMLNGVTKEKDGTIRIIIYKKNVPFLTDNSFSRFLIKQSYFYRFLNEMGANIAKKYDKKLKIHYYLLAEEKNKAALDKITLLSKDNHIKLLLIIFPRLEDFTDYSKINLHNEIKHISQENNISFLDLLDSFKTYDYKQLRLKPDDDMHPNELGYNIAINEILKHLKKEKLIPENP